MVTAPRPHERIRQRLLKHSTITVPRCTTESVTVVIAFGFEGGSGAFAITQL